MRKGTLIIALALVMVVAWSMNVYAADGQVTAWEGFWSSVGGFVYNALPWNWGNWWGK